MHDEILIRGIALNEVGILASMVPRSYVLLYENEERKGQHDEFGTQ